MTTVVHFEMPAENTDRAQKFYAGLFGWKMDRMSPVAGACGDYWFFNTSEKKESICGGIMKRQCATHGPTIYFGVDHLEDATAKVKELGGKVIMEKTAVPTHGYFVCCLDTEGNGFALWQDDKEAK